MQGKTTFILTDKDTGRVVDKREEKNMATDFIKDVFNMPRFALIGGNLNTGISKMLPMYNYLLHGLILFDCNIPEKKDDYIINGRYNMIATAGDVYSGTSTTRGTFNQNLSGEIENGYRFVWDFSPERAVGTIRCASMTSSQMGNQGGVIANALDLSNNSASKALAIPSGVSTNYMMYRNKCYYYYNLTNSSKTVNIYRYSMADPDSIGINSTRSLKLEETYSLPLPYVANFTFPNTSEGRFYVSHLSLGSGVISITSGYVDLDSKEFVQVTPTTISVPVKGVSSYSMKTAIYNNQIYIFHNSNIYVVEYDGTLVKAIPINIISMSAFAIKDNRLLAAGSASSGNYYIALLGGDEIIYLPNVSAFSNYDITEHEDVKYPYIVQRNDSYLYINLRTDYMATINNLSEPLEKTDRHALQVQYEITDG